MAGQNDALGKAYECAGAIAKHARVKLNGSNKLAVATASDAHIGTLRDESFADGDVRTVFHRTKQGTQKYIADEAISREAFVYGAAAGKVTDKPNGNFVGIALSASSADGEIIEVLELPQDPRRFEGANTETLSGAKTLTAADKRIQALDPGGSNRDVNLPAEADAEGLDFWIFNTADAAEVLTVKDDGGSTIVTPTQNEGAYVVCDGTAWRGIASDSN